MHRRKLITALAGVAVFGTAFGAAVLPASADPRTFVVTLLGGSTVTVTVDVPPGTPADKITFPGISTPVVGVREVTPQPTPGVTVQPPQSAPPPEEQQPEQPSGTGGDGGSSASGEKPQADTKGSRRQKTTRRRSAGAQGDTPDLVSVVEQRGRRTGPSKVVPGRMVDGTPTLDHPTFSLATPGAAPIGVPNFMIEKFRIPPFLLPIYQAAGIQYGIRWELLAAINEIETDYGRNLNVSSAGALGWMQFMPATWRAYGVDANRDGVKDPYNPVDAIFAAARYLRAAGAETDLRKAIFAYNHADWYVDSVILRARVIGGLPSNFVGSLTGLTQGRFPVAARATYANDLSDLRLVRRKQRRNPAFLVQADVRRRGINVYSRAGAPVIAVNDGRILRIGRSKRLGRFVQLQDVYGNTYTYGRLGKVAKLYPAPRPRSVSPADVRRELDLPVRDAAPRTPASVTARERRRTARPAAASTVSALARPKLPAKERLFANPFRPRAVEAGSGDQLLATEAGFSVFRSTFTRVFGVKAKAKDVTLKRLQVGSRVVAGTVLGRIGASRRALAPHVLFEIRPAGRGAPRIDPKPILDGWKLLESTAIYRAAGKNPFFGPDAKNPSIGQILLMSKEALIRRVLTNPRIEMYGCGRRDVRLGQVDRRVLATLEFLAASGIKPTVTSLKCGHSIYTASGNVSHHSSGNAVDIARLNGISVLGNQGRGSITELAVQRLLTLQGMMKPDQIITLMEFEGADNTFAMSDHHDHIHVGWRPLYGTNSKAAKQVNAILEPDQWIDLIARLREIDNPEVPLQPSKYALKVTRRASKAHKGE